MTEPEADDLVRVLDGANDLLNGVGGRVRFSRPPPAAPPASGRRVNRRLERVVMGQHFFVRERQHLAQVYAANPSRWINPEICIRQACPHEASGWASGRRLLGIDLKA